jgi:hypothetical protein
MGLHGIFQRADMRLIGQRLERQPVVPVDGAIVAQGLGCAKQFMVLGIR